MRKGFVLLTVLLLLIIIILITLADLTYTNLSARRVVVYQEKLQNLYNQEAVWELSQIQAKQKK
jgi:Tfp pilus assembly protein PilX